MYILYLRIALSKYIVVSDRCAYGVIFRLLLFLRDFMVCFMVRSWRMAKARSVNFFLAKIESIA